MSEPLATASVATPAAMTQTLATATVQQIPVAERIALDADTLFDFDKASLRPDGRVALSEFAAQNAAVSDAHVTVVGHTDRIGSEAYNQSLSERRAATVRDYLIEAGLTASRISTKGMGEQTPLTRGEDCREIKRARLIDCLQPDRRVEIVITGQRMALR
jgi:OOP family OmpA-OmpF porin